MLNVQRSSCVIDIALYSKNRTLDRHSWPCWVFDLVDASTGAEITAANTEIYDCDNGKDDLVKMLVIDRFEFVK